MCVSLHFMDVCPRLWVASFLRRGNFPRFEVSDLFVDICCRVWSLWSFCGLCGLFAQVARSLICLWVHIPEFQLPDLFDGICHVVWGLWTIWHLKSLICWWLHVQVVRSVISLLGYVPGCQFPDLFVGSVWRCELSGVFTAVNQSVKYLTVWGCLPRTWVLSSFCFQHALGVVWSLALGGCTSQDVSSLSCQGVRVPGSVLWGLGMYFQAYEISGLFADTYVCWCLYI